MFFVNCHLYIYTRTLHVFCHVVSGVCFVKKGDTDHVNQKEKLTPDIMQQR